MLQVPILCDVPASSCSAGLQVLSSSSQELHRGHPGSWALGMPSAPSPAPSTSRVLPSFHAMPPLVGPKTVFQLPSQTGPCFGLHLLTSSSLVRTTPRTVARLVVDNYKCTKCRAPWRCPVEGRRRLDSSRRSYVSIRSSGSDYTPRLPPPPSKPWPGERHSRGSRVTSQQVDHLPNHIGCSVLGLPDSPALCSSTFRSRPARPSLGGTRGCWGGGAQPTGEPLGAGRRSGWCFDAQVPFTD